MADDNKLDSRAKHLLATLRGSEETDPSSQVGVLLRGRSAFSEEQLASLRADGAQIRTVAGDVLSCDVPLGSVERLTRHDFVLAVEVSQPLYPEDSEAPSPPFSDVE